MFSLSVLGMPNKVCPFPGTKKNLQIFCLLLYSNFTLNMLNCVIVVLLYVFNFMLCSLVAANCSFVALGNNFLYV